MTDQYVCVRESEKKFIYLSTYLEISASLFIQA